MKIVGFAAAYMAQDYRDIDNHIGIEALNFAVNQLAAVKMPLDGYWNSLWCCPWYALMNKIQSCTNLAIQPLAFISAWNIVMASCILGNR